MNREQKQRLIEALLDCQTVRELGARHTIVEELPPEIRNNIKLGNSSRVDVINIVARCLPYANGLQTLIEIIQDYEGDTTGMGKVREAAAPVLAKLAGLPGMVVPATLAQPFPDLIEAPYFVGRQEELLWLEERLTQFRERQIVGLWGLGGIGKTSLAARLAHTLRDFFEDGVLWAQLDVTSPEAIWEDFARDFGQAEAMAQEPDLPHKATLGRQILADKHILIILDNVKDSEQITSLLPDGPYNTVLITTRNRKALIDIGVAPDNILDISIFDMSRGLALLTAMLGETRMRAEDVAARQTIELVGGLPLALNIVGSYLAVDKNLRIVSYNRWLADKQTRLESLMYQDEGEDEDKVSKGVMASFEVSYQHLPPAIQGLFSALSIFDGPHFDVETAAAVADISSMRAQQGLSRLQSLSLVGYATSQGEEDSQSPTSGRYRLHPLLKDFAAYKLRTQFADQIEALHQRAALYFADLAHRNKQNHAALDLDWPNIFGALCWAYEQKQWPLLLKGVQGLTAVNLGVFGFLDARGHWREARQLLEYAIEAIEVQPDAFARADMLAKRGAFAVRLADYLTAEVHLQNSLALLADMPLSTPVLELRVYIYDLFRQMKQHQDKQIARAWLKRGLQELEQIHSDTPQLVPDALRGYLYIHLSSLLGQTGLLDEAAGAILLGLTALPSFPTPTRVDGILNLSNILAMQDEPEQSLSVLQEGVEMAQALGDARRLAKLWQSMGVTEDELGHTAEAIQSYELALELYRRIGDVNQESFIRANLGLSYLTRDDEPRAAEHLEAAVRLTVQHALNDAEAYARINSARLYIRQKRWMQADAALARAHTLCKQLGMAELAEVLYLQAEVALRSEEIDKALALAEEAIQTARDNEDILAEGVSWRVKGDILQKQGPRAAAVAAYRTSLELLKDQDPYELARTDVVLAQIYVQDGRDLPMAKELLQTNGYF